MRDLYLQIDDLPESTLLFGETLALELPVGSHRIKVTTRLYTRTANFEIVKNESVAISVANVSSLGILSVIAFISGSVNYKPTIQVVRIGK